MKKVVSLIVLAFVSATIFGCGAGNPYAPGKVSGTLTYEDGSTWTHPDTTVYFYPQAEAKDAKTFPRYGSSTITDGKFDCATTYEYADGVIQGTCKVVVKPSKDGQELTGKALKKVLDPKFADAATTPLTFEIKSGSNTLDIKVTK